MSAPAGRTTGPNDVKAPPETAGRPSSTRQGAVKSLPAPTPCSSNPDCTPGSRSATHSAIDMPPAAAAGGVPGAHGPAAAAAAASLPHVQPKQGVREQAGQLRARLRAGSVTAAACLALLAGMGIGVAGALILGFTINGRGFDALSFFLFAVLVGGFLTILFGCLCVETSTTGRIRPYGG